MTHTDIMPAPDSLSLSGTLAETLIADARAAGNREICGLLIESRSKAIHPLPIDNCADQSATRFEMAPAQLLRAMRDIRERHQRLVAIYHSHPTSAAHPSAHDLAGHSYPQALALIISPGASAEHALRAWRLVDGRFMGVPLWIDGMAQPTSARPGLKRFS